MARTTRPPLGTAAARKAAAWAETARLHAAFHVWIPRHYGDCQGGDVCEPLAEFDDPDWANYFNPDPTGDPIYLMAARAQLPQGSPWCVVLWRASRLLRESAQRWEAGEFGEKLIM